MIQHEIEYKIYLKLTVTRKINSQEPAKPPIDNLKRLPSTAICSLKI